MSDSGFEKPFLLKVIIYQENYGGKKLELVDKNISDHVTQACNILKHCSSDNTHSTCV